MRSVRTSGSQAPPHKPEPQPSQVWSPPARGPTALFDEGTLLPRTDLFQFDQLGWGFRRVLEAIDADGSECLHHGDTGTLLYHLLRGTSDGPAAPAEADGHCCCKSDESPLHEA